MVEPAKSFLCYPVWLFGLIFFGNFFEDACVCSLCAILEESPSGVRIQDILNWFMHHMIPRNFNSSHIPCLYLPLLTFNLRVEQHSLLSLSINEWHWGQILCNLFELWLGNFAMDNSCCGQEEQVVCCTALTVQSAKSKCYANGACTSKESNLIANIWRLGWTASEPLRVKTPRVNAFCYSPD